MRYRQATVFGLVAVTLLHKGRYSARQSALLPLAAEIFPFVASVYS
jgi:hypothetical protein